MWPESHTQWRRRNLIQKISEGKRESTVVVPLSPGRFVQSAIWRGACGSGSSLASVGLAQAANQARWESISVRATCPATRYSSGLLSFSGVAIRVACVRWEVAASQPHRCWFRAPARRDLCSNLRRSCGGRSDYLNTLSIIYLDNRGKTKKNTHTL